MVDFFIWEDERFDKLEGTTLASLHKYLPPTGIFVIRVRGHVLAYIDGKIVDSCFEPGKRVVGIDEII